MTDDSLAAFLDELAADPPGPAAGSAAAVVVAMAAALLELAARRSGQSEVSSRAATLRMTALPLAEADARAYATVLRSRGDDRATALRRASDVLGQIGIAAAGVQELAASLVERVKPALHGEVAAASELAQAARRVSERLVLLNRAGSGGGAMASQTWGLARRAELSRGTVAWDVFGAGPPVVLVHGTPSWSYLWRNVVPGLAREFTVHVFDLPGYGDSPAPSDGNVSIATHATTLVELLDFWALEAPAAAGHDIGGAILLRAHLIHQRALQRLVLIDAVALAPWITPTTRHIQAHLDVYGTMPNEIFDRVAAAHLRTAVHGDFDESAFDAYHGRWRGVQGQAAYLHRVAHFDEEHTRQFEPLLGTIRVPALVVWGANDEWLDQALARRLGALIPRSAIRLIAGAGHFAMEDAPAEVTQTLLEFLRSPASQAAGAR
ncbi:MAG: alpha/beta hydrolase [Chloroflexi bacterium]|nr:alpha/beta hydrolase [Chloroflexota bacterium]